MLLDAHAHYQHGFLPAAGGIFDQPNFVMQGIRLIQQRLALNNRQRSGSRGPKTQR